MDWRKMGAGPGGYGTLWMADVAGGFLWMFVPPVGSCTLTFAPANLH